MGSRKLNCPYCHGQFMGTPGSTTYRCRSCGQLILVAATSEGDAVPPGTLRLNREIWKWSKGSPSASTLPKPEEKPVPGPKTGQHHHTKRAVLCGVTYPKRNNKLKGTINDVNRMKSLLVDCFQFPEAAIRVLTEGNDPNFVPTKCNIQRSLEWLVDGCKAGDSLVFFFSGHGLRQVDLSGDEHDGYDETIAPSDFVTAGLIVDDDINDTIVKPLKKGVTLHAIVDACHSGTILDLEHVYNHRDKKWIDNKALSGAKKGTDGGLAISLSACADDQMATDTNALSGNEMSGAMTYILDQAIRGKPTITYGELLRDMQRKTQHANRTRSWLRKLFGNKILQDCQLSSSQVFNVDEKKIQL
ncbi:metacaspase-1-like isoform X2 [Diospyros lotus]|uniref:metacaspase-1-like isoform X2 n=1 Tax=Diospyros lotus TaxID=55363 RepID=UPI002254B612|nr:metacaspase-1-like isoform X2 [Diospyros lotus]